MKSKIRIPFFDSLIKSPPGFFEAGKFEAVAVSPEQALRDCESNYCNIVEQVNDLIVIVQDGLIKYANWQSFLLLGYTSEEILGTSLMDYVHPKERENVISVFSDHVAGEWLPAKYETLLVHKDGSSVAVEVKNGLVVYQNRPADVVLMRDITDRKLAEEQLANYHAHLEEIVKQRTVDLIAINNRLRAEIAERKQVEEALKKSEQEFRIIFENANDEIFYLDKFGTIVDRNRKGSDILGYTLEDVICKNINEFGFMMPEQKSTMMDLFNDAMKREKARGLTELKLIRKDGKTVHTEASISPLTKDDQLEGILVILRDITARKQAEERILQRNRELFTINSITKIMNEFLELEDILNHMLESIREILNIKHCGIVVIDKDEQNENRKAYHGLSDNQLKIASILGNEGGYLEKVARSESPLLIESISDSIESIPGIQSAVTEDNLESMLGMPLNVGGRTLGAMFAITQKGRVLIPDEIELLTTISHQVSSAIMRSELEEEASRVKALEELDLMRTELLANVSHELRTPLAAIKGFATSLLRKDTEWEPEVQEEFLSTISQESDRLAFMISDLVQMGRLEAGQMRFDMKMFTIAEIIALTKERLDVLLQDHEFCTQLPPGLAPVLADGERIGEVITNLIENAVSNSQPGSTITIEAEEIDEKIVVSITDQGIGISRKHIKKIFDRFYQIERHIKGSRKGTGLGLAICKGIIESHGGTIWVESKLGKGSTFSFSLPVYDRINNELLREEATYV